MLSSQPSCRGVLAGLNGIVMKAIDVDGRVSTLVLQCTRGSWPGLVMQADDRTFLHQYAAFKREQTGGRV